ncbi:hypothetical protein GDO86_000817 [Hymenochirus boettgeri]|uniref:Uncharacterized protein n=1 Tax=Hymenochirus boettgeri TaxID=247094 RepID=A0A8T2KDD7_9PIPI|nr:hypothetical protein GDO86_000817 [Hymenochirus boettgeri]
MPRDGPVQKSLRQAPPRHGPGIFPSGKLQDHEITALNFFAALLLAVEMEEDFFTSIIDYRLGKESEEVSAKLKRAKMELWTRMDYRALVTRQSCDQMMAANPSHWAWQREQSDDQGWARKEIAESTAIICLASYCQMKLRLRNGNGFLTK